MLAAGGISINYLPATETPTSIESAGLAVSVAQDVPSQGKVTTTYILGRVSTILEPGGLASTEQQAGPLAGIPDVPGSDPVGLGAPAASDVGDTASTGSFQTTAVGAVPSLGPGDGRTATPGRADAGGARGLALPLLGHTSSGIYLALVGASFALLIAAGLVGGLGIRLLPSAAATSAAGTSVLRLPPR